MTVESIIRPKKATLTETSDITLAKILSWESFHAYGEVDQSEGRGGTRSLGAFATLEEALTASRGKGVQGDNGYVSYVTNRILESGEVQGKITPVTGRRRTPEGTYLVGFLDMREYEFAVRSAADGPVRIKSSSLFAEKFAVPGGEYADATVLTAEKAADAVRALPSELVVLWRNVGDTQWRGELLAPQCSEW